MSFSKPNFNLETVIACGFVLLAAMCVLFKPQRHSAIVRVDGLCCERAADPIVQQIKELPGVCDARYSSEHILVELTRSPEAAQDSIWQAVHEGVRRSKRDSISPVSLSIDGKTVLPLISK